MIKLKVVEQVGYNKKCNHSKELILKERGTGAYGKYQC
jgi:hypothetical protein